MTFTTARPDPDPADAEATHDLAVELRSVSRGFGDVKALDDLTLTAPAHAITVLLGPNGAGKTTAIRMITGALNPDSGSVRVFGLDPGVEGEQVRRRCGVVSAKPALYDRLSGWDNLGYAAELYGLGRGDAAGRAIRESAARFGIEAALDQQVGGYSTGMKTRLALARSVMHGPELLLFDEPTSGLDPESSHAVLELIREMADTGSTVVMCTHLLLEAEGLAERVVILDGGTDLIAGSPGDLTGRFWPHLVVRLDAEDPADLDRVAGMEGVVGYERDDRGLEASGSGAGGATVQLDDLARVPEVVFALAAAGVRVTRVEPHVPSLEDLYFAVRDGREAFSEQGRGTSREVAA
ncbi:MAG: ABC transporter ATP-binding protein [Acidimicrobiales bacterium]|nr:ABC transporter ATP-binding protein [Acidimicrobiales bacterium]MCB1016133.1 ABC transporter ATP-binding protein [Acidimicrobiales bacterium]MCB9371279.1 ABC transporter ATP-binding protein [Microthrixaceae bacterium]